MNSKSDIDIELLKENNIILIDKLRVLKKDLLNFIIFIKDYSKFVFFINNKNKLVQVITYYKFFYFNKINIINKKKI